MDKLSDPVTCIARARVNTKACGKVNGDQKSKIEDENQTKRAKKEHKTMMAPEIEPLFSSRTLFSSSESADNKGLGSAWKRDS